MGIYVDYAYAKIREMTSKTPPLTSLLNYLKHHKIKSIVLVGAVFMMTVYALVFFIPKSIEFSYAGETCAPQLTIFPGLHKTNNDDGIAVSFRDEIRVGSVALASKKVCFSAERHPHEGNITITSAPFGGWIARKQFTLTIPAAPVANTAPLGDPLPVSKPLQIELSEPDSIFTYKLASEQQLASCTAKERQLHCDVPTLALEQGKQYTLKLTKQFKSDPSTTIAEKIVKTLPAVTIKHASIKSGQTIYNKPTSFSFAADKPLAQAEVQLTTTGESPTVVTTTTVIKDKTLTVNLEKQLTRETTYNLKVASLQATDGSTLVDPDTRRFTVSGGPQVTGISIGTNRVSSTATAVIQFDQKLSEDVDIKRFVSFRGGSASIAKSTSTVSVTLQGLPRCQAFSISVAKGLKSKYGIVSSKDWSYSSRTTCHTVRTIGYSVNGRPLQAYYFGSGGTTVLFTGAIHGNEVSSNMTMNGWIDILESQATSIPKNKQIVVVPAVNPDGLAVYGRKNAHGVNLNRNFPTANWQKDIKISSSTTDKGAGGKSAGSEPETKALMALTRSLNPSIVVTYHSSGSLVNSNLVSPAASWGRSYAANVGYSFVADADTAETFGFTMTGTYEDWLSETGRAAFLIELPSDYGDYSSSNRSAMWNVIIR